MLPGETAVWAVLVETVEEHGCTCDNGEAEKDRGAVLRCAVHGQGQTQEPRVWFEQIGYVSVPARTQRSTVLKKLLDGQTVDGEGGDVPQIPMHAGEHGAVHLVPAELLGEAVPVRARATVLFEVVA